MPQTPRNALDLAPKYPVSAPMAGTDVVARPAQRGSRCIQRASLGQDVVAK